MAFGRYTRHAQHCRRSPPALLLASNEDNWLTEQYSSRSIRQMHSTMWTINNCSIVSTTPTWRQQPVAGSTTMCRTDESKLSFVNKNLKAERLRQKWYKVELSFQRSSIAIWPTFQHRLRNQADHIRRRHYHLHIRTSYGWTNQWPQHPSVESAQLYQHKKLAVSTAESTVILFTPNSHEHHLHPQWSRPTKYYSSKRSQRC